MKNTKKSDYIQNGLVKQNGQTYWEKTSQVYALIILSVFPLLTGFQGYFQITESKQAIFRIFTWIYAATCFLIVVGFLLEKRQFKARFSGGCQKLNLTQILAIAYVLWALISALVSPYKENTWLGMERGEGLCAILVYVIAFVLLSLWGEYTAWYAYGTAIMTILVSVLGILQPLGIDFFTPEGYDFWSVHFISTIGNVDMIGGIAAIVVPTLLCAYVVLSSSWRWVCLSGAFLMFYLMLFTDVDSGKVGILAALVLSLPFLLINKEQIKKTLFGLGILVYAFAVNKIVSITSEGVTVQLGTMAVFALGLGTLLIVLAVMIKFMKKDWPISEKTMRLIVAGLILLVIIVGLVVLYSYSGENVLLSEASQMLHGNLSDDAGSGRGKVWKLSLQLMKEHPLFGAGPGCYLALTQPYTDSGYLGLYFDFAHNDFLQIGCCLGIVGLVIYLAFIGTLAWKLLKNTPRCNVLLIFASGMVGYLGHVFFSFSIEIVSPLFWVLAGLADKCIRQLPEGKEKVQVGEDKGLFS